MENLFGFNLIVVQNESQALQKPYLYLEYV